MSKNKIEANKDDYSTGSEEDDIINDIFKKDFLAILEKNGFGSDQLKILFQEKKINIIEQSRFNAVLRKIKNLNGIGISEMVVLLENNIFRLKKIMSILDEETIHIIKYELADKYKIKIDRNTLYQLLS